MLLGAVIASFLLCYATVIQSLVQQWLTNELYTHGFLIPFISAYIVLQRRERLHQLQVRPDLAWGWPILTAGLLLLVGGNLASLASVQQVSLLVSLIGAALLLFGRDIVRELWFALAYLLFMIPVWEVVTTPLQWSFQWMSADIGSRIMRAVGVPVRLQGVFIELPSVTLEVADVCSGIHFLVAILALALPTAYVRLSRTSLRMMVLVISVAVALLTNGLRVALIGVLAYSGVTGPDIHGPAHALQGLFVAVFGILAMLAIIQGFATLEARQSGVAQVGPTVAAALPVAGGPQIAVSLVLAAVGLLLWAKPGVAVPARVDLNTPPSAIGEWRLDQRTDRVPAVAPIEGSDREVTRRYTRTPGRSVSMQVSYFERQMQGKELVGEDSAALHVGDRAVPISVGGQRLLVRGSTQLAGGQRRSVVFWYNLNGRITGNRLEAKTWTAWQTLTTGRSNGALVVLATDAAADGSGSAGEVDVDLKAFAEAAIPSLAPYLPE